MSQSTTDELEQNTHKADHREREREFYAVNREHFLVYSLLKLHDGMQRSRSSGRRAWHGRTGRHAA
jgi:hypothetical protein